jgi:hypothetical protein
MANLKLQVITQLERISEPSEMKDVTAGRGTTQEERSSFTVCFFRSPCIHFTVNQGFGFKGI